MYFKKPIFATLYLIIGFHQPVISQPRITLINEISDDDVVFDGFVTKSTCFISPKDNLVYTADIVKINKIFKGKINCGSIEIVTEGGEVGGDGNKVFHGFMLGKGAGFSGLFLAYSAPIPSENVPNENPKAFVGGDLYGYSIYHHDTFPSIADFRTTKSLYKFIDSITGHPFTSCQILNEPGKLPPTINKYQTPPSGKNKDAFVGGSPQSIENIEVYPNPFTSTATIKVPNSANATLTIFDDSGKTVFQKENMGSTMLENIDLSFLKAGNYIGKAVAASGNKVYNFKLSKL